MGSNQGTSQAMAYAHAEVAATYIPGRAFAWCRTFALAIAACALRGAILPLGTGAAAGIHANIVGDADMRSFHNTPGAYGWAHSVFVLLWAKRAWDFCRAATIATAIPCSVGSGMGSVND
jgi:hypothetical protein